MLPQTHLPPAQASATVESHPKQVPPSFPQVLSEAPVHTPVAQHPVGQDVESQTQAPPRQRWPVAHAVVAPHRQLPPVAQLSAASPLHARQADPPAPQVMSVGAVQAPLLQQPLGQLRPSQVPPVQTEPLQVWPGPQTGLVPHRQAPDEAQTLAVVALQATQLSPALPQVVRLRRLQAAPAQQPEGHEVASQTHRPPTQRWPPAQAAPGPHLQPPPAQVSLRVRSHEAHAPPTVPQLDSDIALQVRPVQQPPGHEVGSQVQLPPTQRCPAPQVSPVPH